MFVVMLTIDPMFTLLAVLATPPLAWATHRSRLQLRVAARRVRKADGELASAATEDLSAIHLVQAFTLERDRLGRFSALSGTSLAAGLESVRLQSRFGPLVELVEHRFDRRRAVVRRAAGARRPAHARASCSCSSATSARSTSRSSRCRSCRRSSARARPRPSGSSRCSTSRSTSSTGRTRSPGRSTGKVELRDVSFSYGREPVLDDVSFTIEAGQNVALVGPTGAGKSTIAALIPRLVDVDAGRVLVDGIDVRELPARVAAQPDRHRAAGHRAARRHAARQHHLRPTRTRPSARCERAARLALVDEFAEPAARRARHPRRRARREPLRRAAPAGRDRPGDPARRADHHPGRADLGAGRRRPRSCWSRRWTTCRPTGRGW